MTTLKQMHDAMFSHNQHVAYGSECNAWQDFVNDSYTSLGKAPWADEIGDIEVTDEFANYWSAVAAGSSANYNAETGARVAE